MPLESLNILVLARYGELGASSRYRFYQFLPFLTKVNLSFRVSWLLSNGYLESLYKGNSINMFLSAALGYLQRFIVLISSRKVDLVWLEKELLPWVPWFLESVFLRLGPPYVVDFDDAIFHNYDQHRFFLARKLYCNKIRKLMKGAAVVVAGNNYIADYAREAGAKRVEIIPTVLNPKKYGQVYQKRTGQFRIGWIGSPSTSRHLGVAKPALREIFQKHSSGGNGAVQFVAIGAQPRDLRDLQASIISWSEETEADNLRSLGVGIMPLPDTEWERGKCGFKLIQYMACGLPVIASPVGVNRAIIEHGVNGYLAVNTKEWVEYFEVLKENPDLCRKMGTAGRKKVEEQYSLEVTAPKLVNLLREAMKV